MKGFTATLGISGLLIFALGAILVIINIFLTDPFRLRMDNLIKEIWIRINNKGITDYINKYTIWTRSVYLDPQPLPSSGRRLYYKGRKIRNLIQRKTVYVISAFILPLFFLILIRIFVRDDFLYLYNPNLFNQNFTVSGTLSVIVTCGLINFSKSRI